MDYATLHREAVIRENTLRDLAFLNCPETICGIEVKPMTVEHLLMLGGAENPFLYHTPEPSEEAIVQMVLFLWAVSTKYSPSGEAKKLFAKSCRDLNYKKTSEAIRQYVDDSFMDSPPTKSGTIISYTSFAASVIDLIASEYHWSETEIIGMPLKRIFQYMRRIAARNGETVFFNPSDKIRGDWLRFNTECAQKMAEYELDLQKPYRWENN